MSVEKRVTAYLELASNDAETVELLVAGGNRFAAYHMQQAVEKIVTALLLAKRIEAGIEHASKSYSTGFPRETSGWYGSARWSATRHSRPRFATRLRAVGSQRIRPRTPFVVTSPS